MGQNIKWSKEMLDDIEYFTNLKMPSAEVACKMSLKYKLGITKNHIIGAARRNGIDLYQPVPQKNNANLIWTPEKILQFRTMWNNNLPMTAIAENLGISRDILSRRAITFKFPDRNKTIVRQGGGLAVKLRTKKNKPIQPASAPPQNVQIVKSKKPKKFLDLNRRDCRFVINDGPSKDFLFCAMPAEPGSAYCKHCHQIVYYKPSHNLERLNR